MSSKEKTNKITSFFKPRTDKGRETNEEGDKLNSENSSIVANSNDQASEINNNKNSHTKMFNCLMVGNIFQELFILAHRS